MGKVRNVTLASIRLCSLGGGAEAKAAAVLGDGMRLLIAWQSPRVDDRMRLLHVPTQTTAELPLAIFNRRLISADTPGRSTRRWLRQAALAHRKRQAAPSKAHKALVDALLSAMAGNGRPG